MLISKETSIPCTDRPVKGVIRPKERGTRETPKGGLWSPPTINDDDTPRL